MAPITSVALRYIGCTFESPIYDVKSASARLKDYSTSNKSHMSMVRSINKVLDKVLDEEVPMIPYYLSGDVVWCVYGGYGYWPAVVGKIETDGILVHFSHADGGIDCLDVPSDKVKSSMRPFLEGFSEIYPRISLSTRGFIKDFRAAMLKVIPFVGIAHRDGLLALVDENARLRLDKINGVFVKYLSEIAPFVLPEKLRKKTIAQLFSTDERRKAKVIRDIERLTADIKEKKEKTAAIQKEREMIQKQEDAARLMMKNVPAMLKELNQSRYEHLLGCNRVTRNKRVGDSSDFSLDDHLSVYEQMSCEEDSFSSNSDVMLKYVYTLYLILKQMGGMQVTESHICKAIKVTEDITVIKLLLLRFYPVDIWHSPISQGRNTMIHVAVINDRPDVIEILVEFYGQLEGPVGFVLDECDKYGRTPLHVACEKGRYKCVQVLCRLKASVDAVCHSGWTALMWCGGTTHSHAIMHHLLRMGASIHVTDKKGFTALYWYIYYGYTLLAQAMLKKGEWLNQSELESFVQDMSLGLEKFPVILDILPMDVCKIKYCESSDAAQQIVSHIDQRHSNPMGRGNGGSEGALLERRSERKMDLSATDNVALCGTCDLSDELLRECALKSESAIIPKFIYSMNTVQLSSGQDFETLTGCCQCVGDCRKNPNCPCLLRNGQRFPYNEVNGNLTYDFYKNKLYECGPDCNCSKLTEEEIDRNSNSRVRDENTSALKCSLRLTQRGISAAMIVCNTNGKGLGVMTTQSYIKGSFICAYTGEIVSEKNLVRQENRKEKKGTPFVTYAYQIHEGKGEFNVDSEYVGSVSRFFNHSCDPNIRPCKVVISGVSHHPSMCFFALKNIPIGEELTWKYVSGTNKRSGQKCGCGSSNCVGFV